MKVKMIKVSGCHDCPFANFDYEEGLNGCHVDMNVEDGINEFPEKGRPKNCPLNEEPIAVMGI